VIQGKRVVKGENSRVLFHRSVLLSITKTQSGGPAGAPAGPHVGEPDPEDPIPPRQGPADWPLKDRELMAEREGLRERSGRQADGVLDRHSRFGGRTGKERFARLELGGPLHRAFSIDVLACPQCGGRLRLIATLHDPAVIRKFLAHLGMARQGRVLVPPHPSLAALAPDPILEGGGGGRGASASTRHSC
jgi:hypothetical protein